MYRYKCTDCDAIHSVKEWNEKTKKRYGEDISSIESELKEDSVYICPTCEKEIDGYYIEEIEQE